MCIKEKLIRTGLVALLLLGTIAPNTFALSVGTTLTKTDKSKSTALLGNTTNKYRLVGSISATSKHSVYYYLYTGPNSSNFTKDFSFDWTKTTAFTKYYYLSENMFTVAKCTMYGRSKKDPSKGCYASVILSNQN